MTQTDSSVNDIVLPGDVINIKSDKNERVILGPGLRRDKGTVYACKAGILMKRSPAIYYVNNYQKRYVPVKGENVLGIVSQKAGDIFKVDIGGSEQASLSYLAFEGASKRNRPDVQIGDAVFGKLLVASKDMEPELVCVDSNGKRGKLGILGPEGMVVSCSLNLIRKILNPDNPFLNKFAQNQSYELAVGMNGRIWINAKSVSDVIAVANAILSAE